MNTENKNTFKILSQKPIRVGEIDFPPRKVWIKTFGCQMNYHDTERILSHLEGLNFLPTEVKEEADLILFNTCAVRDLANTKFYSHLGEIKALKKERAQQLIVGVGGCVAQTESKELIKKYQHLDFVFGTDTIDQINDILYRIYAGESKLNVIDWDQSMDYSIETKITHGSPQAFVNIMKGCNNFCTYCIVPYTRGREKSRRLNEVVQDIKRLVDEKGIQEVTLLGQNVNSFGKEHNESLAQLVAELEKIDGLYRLRYTTSHPYDLSDELIEAHKTSKKLTNHLHLPIQSGSDTVLARMNRRYTREHFLGLCRKIREANPEIVLSSDIIVGFPGETDEEHQATIELLKEARFDFIYSYKYSARKGTKAANMPGMLDQDLKSKRLYEVQDLQLKIQEEMRRPLVGKVFRILVENMGEMKGTIRWTGRSSCNRLVHFEGEPQKDYKWHWVDVEVTSSTALSCIGKLITDHGKIPPH